MKFRVGTWGSDSENEYLNLRKFTNVVEFLEERAAIGSIKYSTIIMDINNSTVDVAFYKGNSSS